MGKFKHFLSFGIIIILIFSFLNKLKAQDTASNISIGAVFDGGYSFHNLEGSLDYLIEMRNEAESPSYGFSGGLNIAYQLSDKWSLKSGINYATRGYKSKGEAIDSDGNVLLTFNSQHKYYYVDVPVLFHYFLRKGALRPVITAGFAVNFFIKEMNKHTQTNAQVEQIICNTETESLKQSPGCKA